MITISLCIIAKNEEATIKRCLNSAKSIADEIIVVDTGSIDRTKEFASHFTDKIYDFEWIDNFSAARNFSFEQATMDYILWLDADDIILPQDAVKFKNLKESLTQDTDVVMMRYDTGFDQEGRVIFYCFRERMVKRSCNFKWHEPVHEHLEVWGKRLISDVCITHEKPSGRESGRNIRIYENLIAKGEKLSPRGAYYYARELKDNGKYAEAIKWFRLFLDSGRGWLEDNITACGELAKCHLAENRPNDALTFMLRSFSYDTPRAETCCQIGYYFKNLAKYKQTAFWFELALKLDKPENNWGFCLEDCWGYIPCMELVVCYDKLGEYEKAEKFNEMAAIYKPNSPEVLHNRKYFENKFANKNVL